MTFVSVDVGALVDEEHQQGWKRPARSPLLVFFTNKSTIEIDEFNPSFKSLEVWPCVNRTFPVLLVKNTNKGKGLPEQEVEKALKQIK